MNPNLAQAHSDLADVLSARGDIKLTPEAYEAHLSLGMILARAGNMSEARAHLAKAAQSPEPQVRQAAQKALR